MRGHMRGKLLVHEELLSDDWMLVFVWSHVLKPYGVGCMYWVQASEFPKLDLHQNFLCQEEWQFQMQTLQ
jgi:hypothetical protein